MNNNQIHIKIKDGQVTCHTDKPMSIQEFMQATCTCTLGMMQSLLAKAPEESKQEIKEDLYDMYNAAASNTLSYFAPDIDMTANQSDSDREEEEQEKKASTEMNRRIQEQERRKKAQQFIFQKQLQEKRDEYDLYVDLWSVICVVMIWAWTIPYVSLVCTDSLG